MPHNIGLVAGNCQRDKIEPDRRPSRAIRLAVPSEAIAQLARAVHPQHKHVAGGLIAARVGTDLVEHSVPAFAGCAARGQPISGGG
jgi:hypothetical protein